MRHWTSLLLCGAGLLACAAVAADEPKAAEPGTLIVLDSAGKEVKLKSWTFKEGVENLSWLAPKPAEDKPDPAPPKGPRRPAVKDGPPAFAFRELESTGYKDGIVTLVPIDRVRSVDYDTEKERVTMRVATSDKPADDVTLVGSTEFKGVNKITLEAEVDKGDLGVAEVKFLGGSAKNSIRGLRFAPPKMPAAPAAGRPATIVIIDGKKPTCVVSDVQALYRLGDGSERLAPLLFFKKTIKIDIAKIKKLSFGKDGEDVTVTLADGEPTTLAPLSPVMLDGKQAELVGLLGRVPAGYRLFPLHTVSEIEFDVEKKADPDKKPDDKKPDDKKPDDGDKPDKLRRP